jgi:hypothetical protein
MRLLEQRHPRTGGFASPSFNGFALDDGAHSEQVTGCDISDDPPWIDSKCWRKSSGKSGSRQTVICGGAELRRPLREKMRLREPRTAARESL